MKIDEVISKEQYREMQMFYFYKKQHRDVLVAIVAFFGISIALINIISTGKVSVGAIVFMVLPIVCVLLTNMRIKSVVDKLYEKDIKEWHIQINSEYISAKPGQAKQGLKVLSRDWYRAYELKTVILLYFNKNQFLTISKKELTPEQLMELKGILYDRLGYRFKLRNQTKAQT